MRRLHIVGIVSVAITIYIILSTYAFISINSKVDGCKTNDGFNKIFTTGKRLTYIIPKDTAIVTDYVIECSDKNEMPLIKIWCYRAVEEGRYTWEVIGFDKKYIKFKVSIKVPVREKSISEFKKEAIIHLDPSTNYIFVASSEGKLKLLGEFPLIFREIAKRKSVTLKLDGVELKASVYIYSHSINEYVVIFKGHELYKGMHYFINGKSGLLTRATEGYVDIVLYKLMGIKLLFFPKASMILKQ